MPFTGLWESKMNNIMPITDWIPQEKYLEIYGEKKNAIDERIKKRQWIKGVHYNVPKGSKGRWINVKAVNEWASGKVNSTAA